MERLGLHPAQAFPTEAVVVDPEVSLAAVGGQEVEVAREAGLVAQEGQAAQTDDLAVGEAHLAAIDKNLGDRIRF